MKLKMQKSTGKKAVWITAVVAVAAVSTVAGVWLYRQLKKMEDYELKYKTIIFRKLSLSEIVFDLYMVFTNKSNLGVTLSKQEYDIYANNVYITTIVNDSPNEIKPKSDSDIGMRIRFTPAQILTKIGVNPTQLIAAPKKLRIKIVMKYKVRVLFFNVSIPEIVFEDTLHNMMNY